MSPLIVTSFPRLLGVLGTDEILIIFVVAIILGGLIYGISHRNAQPNAAAHSYPPAPLASSQTVVVIDKGKSVAVAFLLAFLLGPLGLLYASVTGGILMIIVSAIVAVATMGLGLPVTWLISIIWAVVAAANSKTTSTTVVASSMSNSGALTSTPPLPSENSAGSSEKDSLLNQLTQLHALKEKGVLNQEIYEQQRQIIVAKLATPEH